MFNEKSGQKHCENKKKLVPKKLFGQKSFLPENLLSGYFWVVLAFVSSKLVYLILEKRFVELMINSYTGGIKNNANSVQMQLPTGTELGNIKLS